MAIEFEGLTEVIERIENLYNAQDYKTAMGKCCALVERDAKIKAPKDTGALRNSIESQVEERTGEIVGIVFTPLEYAPYVEFGTGLFAENGGRSDVPWNYQDDEGNWHKTSGQHPQPYLRPALIENREKIKDILKESVNNG